MADFYTLITNIGLAKLANAEITGNKVLITEIAVGDGLNGEYYNPAQTQTALKNEVWRDSVSNKFIDPDNSNKIIFEAQIPITDGGWYIREIGAFDADGDLIAISKVAESYKPTNQQGGADEYLIRVPLLYSNTSIVDISIDPAVVLATRQYVENYIAQHIVRGSGSPEGVITAPVGCVYEDIQYGAYWKKRTGTGNTGWEPLANLNVKDFGAKGDGATDDIIAINSPISYIITNQQQRRPIDIPFGKYKICSPININNNSYYPYLRGNSSTILQNFSGIALNIGNDTTNGILKQHTQDLYFDRDSVDANSIAVQLQGAAYGVLENIAISSKFGIGIFNYGSIGCLYDGKRGAITANTGILIKPYKSTNPVSILRFACNITKIINYNFGCQDYGVKIDSTNGVSPSGNGGNIKIEDCNFEGMGSTATAVSIESAFESASAYNPTKIINNWFEMYGQKAIHLYTSNVIIDGNYFVPTSSATDIIYVNDIYCRIVVKNNTVYGSTPPVNPFFITFHPDITLKQASDIIIKAENNRLSGVNLTSFYKETISVHKIINEAKTFSGGTLTLAAPPVNGTVVLTSSPAGTTYTEGINYTVNYTTGVITSIDIGNVAVLISYSYKISDKYIYDPLNRNNSNTYEVVFTGYNYNTEIDLSEFIDVINKTHHHGEIYVAGSNGASDKYFMHIRFTYNAGNIKCTVIDQTAGKGSLTGNLLKFAASGGGYYNAKMYVTHF